MEIFKSKIDSWLLVTLLLSMGLASISGYMVIKQGGVQNILLSLFIFCLGVGLPIWILTSTQYIVTQETLKVKSGPFSWTIPISSIVSVRETRNLLSSPALSLDRLELVYKSTKKIMVSPKNKEGFLNLINENGI